MRSVSPRMEEDVEKGCFEHDMAKIIGSQDAPQSSWKQKGRGKANNVGNAGAEEIGASVETIKRLYPAGKRNAIQVRSLAMSNAQTIKSGVPICWDFASHAGCAMNAKCANAHGNMSAKTFIGA